MPERIKGVVCVQYDESGEISFHVFGDGDVRLFVVDERCPHDRVYEITTRTDPASFRSLVPEGVEIGHCGDDRHEAITNRISAPGRHLTLVGKDRP